MAVTEGTNSNGEQVDTPKSPFDLGVFVGDLAVVDDDDDDAGSGDDISFEGLEQELVECRNNDVVSNIFSKGTTLRDYSKEVENNLRQVELESIQMEARLSGFQDEIGSISSDIKILQEKSMDMGLKLKNRNVAESKLGKFVEDIIDPPRMVVIIVDGEEELLLEHFGNLDQIFEDQTEDSTSSSDKPIKIAEVETIVKDFPLDGQLQSN